MGVTNKIVGVIVVMFVLGAIGGTAFVMASNSTAYEGANSAVTTVMVILVPVLGGIAIALYLLPRRSLHSSVSVWSVRLNPLAVPFVAVAFAVRSVRVLVKRVKEQYFK